MKDTALVLTFAVVGHPNEGKSSVVSTLTEDDSVRITPIPGETVVCRAFPVVVDGREIVRFVDTPGFQSPLATLEWLRRHEGPGMLGSFLEQNCSDPDFSGECELFRPLTEGAEIIYVLDASRPVRSVDIAEMEILRMTGIPRMAIINNKEEDESFVTAWRDELRKHFNSVRVFNAHRATYAERIALLHSLKSIDQDWEAALGKVIHALEDDWFKRVSRTAWIILDLIEESLKYQVSEKFPPEREPADLIDRLTEEYRDHVRQIERSGHLEIRRLFKHNIFDYRLPEQSVAGDDLFHERTWRILGLKPVQVAAAGAAAGTGIGLGIDAATAGISFGVFALAGALLGAGSALLGGRRMITAEVQGPRVGRFQMKKRLGDFMLIVGPNKNTQFPYILLDRALVFFAHTINWAHGRRDVGEEADQAGPAGFVSGFTDEQRRLCRAFFHSVSAGDENRVSAAKEDMSGMLIRFLMSLSNAEHVTVRA